VSRIVPVASFVLSLLVLSAVTPACSSAVEQGSQSEGADRRVTELTTVRFPPGVGPVATDQCAAQSSCRPSWQRDTGYDAPFIRPVGESCGEEDDAAFSTAMLGCGPEMFSGMLASSDALAFAFCPLPVNYPHTEVIPCNSCTGAPPPGWVVVAWSLSRTCISPSPGCGTVDCLDPD
jgi:hypothetical protein